MSIHMKEVPSPLETAMSDQEIGITAEELLGMPICKHIPEGYTFGEFTDMLGKKTQSFERFMSYYSCALMEIQTKFEVLNEEFSLIAGGNPIESIRTRLKSRESLAGKIQRKGIKPTREEVEESIYDIAGIRVICSFIEDIYTLADCILKQDDITLIRKKDYIANPKPNGYRGLHLIVEIPIFLSEGKRMVKVEIQLRTIAMDFWASLEHKLRYKKNLDEATVAKISDSLQSAAETAAKLDAGMQEIRHDIAEASSKSKQPGIA